MSHEREFPYLPIHSIALEKARNRAKEFPNALAFLVLDVDEVIFSTRATLAKVLYKRLYQKYPHLQDRLPLPEEATKNGVRNTYMPHLGEAYEEEWLAAELTQEHLKNAPLVDSMVTEKIVELEEANYPTLLLLSARQVDAAELTQQEAEKIGISREIPVFAMFPGDEHVAKMKLSVLKELASSLGKPVILIDDAPETIHAIEALEDPLLMGILYETERHPNASTKRRGVWSTMLDVIRRQ